MWTYLVAGALVVAGFASNQTQTLLPRADGAAQPAVAGAPTSGSIGLHTGQAARRTKDPYARLFPVKGGRFDVRTASAAQALNRKTVCGLTIWNVTPDLDPTSIVRPSGSRVDYKIGKIAPTVCPE